MAPGKKAEVVHGFFLKVLNNKIIVKAIRHCLGKINFHFIIIISLLNGFSCTSYTSGGEASDVEKGQAVYINNQEDFDKYKNITFSPGAKILFAKGAIFNGQFAPRGVGTAEAPIIVTAYDPESEKIYTDNIDDKPIINGQGEVNSAFYLYNGEFWEINNLEITNTDGSDEDQGDLRGIHVVAEDIGVAEHIIIQNCYVHNVNGKVGGKQKGGIHFNVYGDSVSTRFDDVRILDNVVKKVGGVGIANQSSLSRININEAGYNPWTNLVIRGNRIEDTGRNSIIFRYSINPIVEYNVSARSSLYDTGHSIVNFNTIDAIMQYNEAYENTGDLEDHERGGYDADYHARGTIIQYNYSHDNHWFCGIMRRNNTDITIRYNISQNELLGSYLYGFPGTYELKDVKVYNNVHYFRKGLTPNIFVGAGHKLPRSPIETSFKNNIFHFEEAGYIGEEPAESTTFEHNLFYNMEPIGTNYLTANPMFADPGKGGTDIDMKASDRLSGYQLQPNSPAIDMGMEIEDNGGEDFWGNSLYNNAPDIGVHEY
jgi:hypothetical protein